MNKKLLGTIIALFATIALASEATDALNMAKEYEKNGDITNAMKFYKKAALLSVEVKSEPNLETQMAKQVDQKPQEQQKDIIAQNGKNTIEGYNDPKTDETVEEMIYSTFNIEAYRMNYLLPVTYDTRSHPKTIKGGYSYEREDVETKFQISFKKSLSEDLMGFDEKIYVAYTQTSWWQTTADSAPFRETNYEPEIFVDIPYNDSESVLKSYRLGLVHQSNGRLLTSKSWNRVYLSGIFQYSGIFFEPKVWYRFDEDEKTDPTDVKGDDNPDILDYLGYGEVAISYPYKEHLFSTLVRKKSVQLDWTFPIFGQDDVYGYLQYFNGYGESLVDYDEKVEKIGIGFAITR